MLPLYKSLVRPQLDYVISAWHPHCHKDIALLEQVQLWATKWLVVYTVYSRPIIVAYEQKLKVSIF